MLLLLLLHSFNLNSWNGSNVGFEGGGTGRPNNDDRVIRRTFEKKFDATIYILGSFAVENRFLPFLPLSQVWFRRVLRVYIQIIA